MEDAKVLALRAHQLHQLKKEAIVYYQANGVPLKMEDALNQMFRDRPDCVFGYLANFFEQLALPPVISGVRCHKSFDSRGAETLAAEVTCRHRNEDRIGGRSRAALQVSVGEHDKPEERDRETQELRQHVEAALTLVNDGPLRQLAEQGLDPRSQRAIDEFLLARLQAEEDRIRAELQRELDETAAASGAEGSGPDENASPQHQPAAAAAAGGKAGGSAKKRGGGKAGKEIVIVPDEPREGLFPGCLALSCLSAACASAGASAAGVPLYRHLRQQLADEPEKDCEAKDWRLPLPMLTILSGGKASPGKSNCVKEYMIVPKPGLPFDRVLRDSVAVYQQVAKSLSVKGGPAARFTNDAGALNTVIDRPEAGFDLINDALKTLELTDSFDLAANIAGHELFDYEKGKYDLAQGTQKTPDETADFLDDLSAKQASLVALIDPLRRVERDAWIRLCQKASQRCLIVGDATEHRPGRLMAELQQMEAEEAEAEPPAETDGQQQPQPPNPQQQPLLTSGWVARLQQRNTITELFDCAKLMRASGQVVVAAVGPSDSGDTAVVDLAVAMGARYLKLGAPVRAERIDKLQRLAEIGEELQACEQLSQWGHLSLPLLRPRGSETPESEQQQQQPNPSGDHHPSAAKSRKSSSSVSKA